MAAPSFMQRKRDELRQRGIDPDRLPPGQYVTDRFPVLHIGPVPAYATLDDWTLAIGGDAVAQPRVLRWAELLELCTADVTVDIHCVTKWSKFDVTWRGVMLADLLGPSGPRAEARTLIARGEHGYSANLDYAEVCANTALVAVACDGEPLAPEHGYPARLVIPHLYFWKSVKWLRGIELWSDERIGFWEQNGYHEHGDPFREQRYWGDDGEQF
ncbi:MAG TPA: molybdopterin-dependent oxidoreductase [Ilumatobacteraceae bacterium]|nr:molybdopterin-dependent oxidoreductase [Ilumatobacteraceae bacterium]